MRILGHNDSEALETMNNILAVKMWAMLFSKRHSGPKFPKNSTFQNAKISIFAHFKA